MKKWNGLVWTILWMVLTSSSLKSDSLVLTEWMKALPDATPLCKLSIPATHDSGALLGKEGGLQTQDISIAEQLESGIRGFDIRLRVNDCCKKLGVYHSILYQQMTWEDNVLPAFIRFLKEHPSETLVVSMKCEGGSSSEYEEQLEKSLQDPANAAYFVQNFAADLTLGDCRGKILFLHRDDAGERYPGALCWRWHDNATFELEMEGSNGKNAVASIEDVYYHEDATYATHKAELTFEHMKSAMDAAPDSYKWFISYASATALPKAGPQAFSDVVNPWLAQKMEGVKKNCGIVLIDFAGTPAAKELIHALIMSNEPLKK